MQIVAEINIETRGTRNSPFIWTLCLHEFMFSSGWESELEEKSFRGQASAMSREATSMEQDAVYFPDSARNSVSPSVKTAGWG